MFDGNKAWFLIKTFGKITLTPGLLFWVFHLLSFTTSAPQRFLIFAILAILTLLCMSNFVLN